MKEIVDPRFCPDAIGIEDSRDNPQGIISEYKIGKKYGMGVKGIKDATKKVITRKK